MHVSVLCTFEISHSESNGTSYDCIHHCTSSKRFGVCMYVCMYGKASDNKRLLSERSEWTTLFSSITASSSSSMSPDRDDKEVSPATVLSSLRFVRMYVCMYVCMYECMNVCIYVYVYMKKCLYVPYIHHTYIQFNIFKHKKNHTEKTYIHLHIHTYAYTYKHTYIHTCKIHIFRMCNKHVCMYVVRCRRSVPCCRSSWAMPRQVRRSRGGCYCAPS